MKIGVDQVINPAGCTKYVQAPVVCWNKLFKELVTEQYNGWPVVFNSTPRLET